MDGQAAYNFFTSFLRRRQFKGLDLDKYLQASVQLLFHILSKRAEKVKEADFEQLVLWARNKGKLQKPSLIFSKIEWQELRQLLWDAVIKGGDGREAVLAPRPPAAAAAAASNPARLRGAGRHKASGMAEAATQTTAEKSPKIASSHSPTVALRCPLPPSSDSNDSEPDPPVVNCSRDKRSQNKIQRQSKVTESSSSSLAERIGRSKAVGCGGMQRAAAAGTGQPPGRTAGAVAAGPAGAGPAGTEPEAAPGRSGHRPRDRRFLAAEQQRKGGDGHSRGLGRAGVGAGGARPHQGRLLSHPHSDAARTGARRRRPLISPQHPAMAAETAAQPGYHGNNNAKSSTVTNGGIATLQQKFQQHFSNSLQKSEDVMKKYSNTECFPRYQEG